jgi:hypothetical protein
VMIPRRVLVDVGGYNEHCNVLIDYELWVRIAYRYRLAILPDVLTVKHSHRGTYFHRYPVWEKYKALIRIRWYAWRRFSRSFAKLRYVIDPIALPRSFVGTKFPQLATLYRKLVDRSKKGKQRI